MGATQSNNYEFTKTTSGWKTESDGYFSKEILYKSLIFYKYIKYTQLGINVYDEFPFLSMVEKQTDQELLVKYDELLSKKKIIYTNEDIQLKEIMDMFDKLTNVMSIHIYFFSEVKRLYRFEKNSENKIKMKHIDIEHLGNNINKPALAKYMADCITNKEPDLVLSFN
jgi:hypothetical protein